MKIKELNNDLNAKVDKLKYSNNIPKKPEKKPIVN